MFEITSVDRATNIFCYLIESQADIADLPLASNTHRMGSMAYMANGTKFVLQSDGWYNESGVKA